MRCPEYVSGPDVSQSKLPNLSISYNNGRLADQPDLAYLDRKPKGGSVGYIAAILFASRI
jgi:hypothetical protein